MHDGGDGGFSKCGCGGRRWYVQCIYMTCTKAYKLQQRFSSNDIGSPLDTYSHVRKLQSALNFWARSCSALNFPASLTVRTTLRSSNVKRALNNKLCSNDCGDGAAYVGTGCG
jgi:hypothetical protein